MASLTRDQLRKLKELDLQKQVLVPLFKAMGFRGVVVWGGGSLEQGKDIVMWKRDDFGTRINYGVVVKAQRISGKAAAGKGSASEVEFQIRQCLASSYIEISSTEEQPIHRCLVVSSKDISKEALHAMVGSLRASGYDRITQFIDGDMLWDLICENMPEVGIVDRLDAVQKKIDTLVKSDHYRVVANTKHEFSIETKYPGAENDQPLRISAAFKFDHKDPQGTQALKDWQRHVKTGAPLTIKSPQLQDFRFPEFLQELIRPSDDMSLTIGPRRSDTKTLLKFIIHGTNGETAVLDYLEFETLQVGTEEATLSNERQPVPWKIILIINVTTGRWDLSFRLFGEHLNVTQALQAVRLQQVLSSGGQIKIVNLVNGFEFPIVKFNPVGTGIDDRWPKLLEALVFIQQKTGIPLTVTGDDVDFEEANRILVTAEVLRTGKANLAIGEWPVESPLPKAKEAAETFVGESAHSVVLSDQGGHVMKVLNTEVPLGPAVFLCEHVHMPEEVLKRLKADIENATADSILRFQLVTAEPVEARFPNWLPDEDAAELRELSIW